MATTVFYNETSMNGKYHVMANIGITGKGIRQTTTVANGIHTHKGDIFKNLHTYWVSKDALEKIKEKYNHERTSFL